MALAALAAFCLQARAQEPARPDATYTFAEKDSAVLCLDWYAPKGETTLDGKQKPAIIWVFGGGFTEGTRDEKRYQVWFSQLLDEGYGIFSIDYRLGLKGVKGGAGLGSLKATKNAIQIGVEDLFSATAFIIDNAGTFGISPDNLVVSGSSAGAIISLEAEYEICNKDEAASVLPEGFNYAGLMAFSGAIFSTHGALRYRYMEPCPQLLLHGTSDKVVNYGKIRFLNLGLFGSKAIAKVLSKNGYSYNIMRYKNHGHDIATSMKWILPEQLRFLESNVIRKSGRIVDSMVDDPEVPVRGGSRNRKELYSN